MKSSRYLLGSSQFVTSFLIHPPLPHVIYTGFKFIFNLRLVLCPLPKFLISSLENCSLFPLLFLLISFLGLTPWSVRWETTTKRRKSPLVVTRFIPCSSHFLLPLCVCLYEWKPLKGKKSSRYRLGPVKDSPRAAGSPLHCEHTSHLCCCGESITPSSDWIWCEGLGEEEAKKSRRKRTRRRG